jgi:hypothetical protein
MNAPFHHIGDRIAHGGASAPFGQEISDRLYHTGIVGQSGTGKSSLMASLILADIDAGDVGVALLDPKGDLADYVLARIPPHRAPYVQYVNPADGQYAVPLNLLALDPGSMKPALVLQNTLEALKSYWGESCGPRLEFILLGCLRTLLACRRPQTLLGVTRLLLDPAYRDWVLERTPRTPKLEQFWFQQFYKWTHRERVEWTMPVINKLDLLSEEPLSFILGQTSNTYRLRKTMALCAYNDETVCPR